MNQKLQVTQQRRGSTLLLALIILSGLVATSLTVGTIVVTRLRGVKAIDDSVLASYAAESAVEDLLYEVRKRERRTDLDASGRLPNGATWKRTVEAPAQELFLDLVGDDTQQLDLLNPSGDLTTAVDVDKLLITASAPSSDAWLEVSWVPWIRGIDAWSPVSGRTLFSSVELQEGQKTIELTAPPFGGTPVAYRVRLRSFSGSVGRVRITARDVNGDTATFPSRIRAKVVGTMGSAQYATRVEFPTSFPLAPVFDYVLFSECDIVKGGTITCPSGS